MQIVLCLLRLKNAQEDSSEKSSWTGNKNQKREANSENEKRWIIT